MRKFLLAFVSISNVLAQMPLILPMPEDHHAVQEDPIWSDPQPVPIPNLEVIPEFHAVNQEPQWIPLVNPELVLQPESPIQPVQVAPVSSFVPHPYGDGTQPLHQGGMELKSMRAWDSDSNSRERNRGRHGKNNNRDRSRDNSDERRRNNERRPFPNVRTTTRRPNPRPTTTTRRPVEVGDASLPCGFTCSRKTVLFSLLDNIWSTAACSDGNADVRVRCDTCCKARGLNAGLASEWSAGFVSNNGRECICCHQNNQCGGRPVPAFAG